MKKEKKNPFVHDTISSLLRTRPNRFTQIYLEKSSLFFHYNSTGSLGYKLFTTINATHSKSVIGNYPLYPHDFDDLIFIIYQHNKWIDEAPRSSAKPILQWFVFILAAAFILYAIRTVARRLARQMNRRYRDDGAPDYLIGSFVDSMGVFLGVALHTIGNSRAERWFLISFSIFGLVFKMFYTDNLFVTFTTSTQNRVTSIDQLFQRNYPISVDYSVTNGDVYYVRVQS